MCFKGFLLNNSCLLGGLALVIVSKLKTVLNVWAGTSASRRFPLEGGGGAPDLVQLKNQQSELDLNKFTLFARRGGIKMLV